MATEGQVHGGGGPAEHDRRLPEALRRFEELAELPEAGVEARLAELAEADPELASLVRRMLAADSDRRPLRLGAPTAEDEGGTDRRIGRRLGKYRLLREIGRGGMGVVYLGERVDGAYEARVAIKVVGLHLAGSDLLERFLLERRLVGRLDHPGIARVLDAGTDDSGTPYFVMEHVDGLPLDRYCDENRLPIGRRLELFREVCDAVAYAHRNLIVHRDLKPGNILVDRRGRPKLLDFGIAKLLETESAHAAVTQLGQRALTPDYASPEQLAGRPVSTASDVYGLGVVLYELLTGRLPFRSHRTGRLGPRTAVRPPSRVVGDPAASSGEPEREGRGPEVIAADRGLPSARALSRRLAGELDLILGKALEEDPERRYGSVPELSEDIRLHLDGLPIQAQPESLLYRWRKFVSRNRVAAISSLLVLLSLVGGMAVSIVQSNRAVAARERAERASTRAEQINRFLLSVFETADPSWYVEAEAKGPETRIIDVLDEASRRIGSELDGAPLEKADLLTTLGNTYRALHMDERAEAHLRQALEIRLEHQGEGHRDTVETLYFLAASISDDAKAIPVWERVVAAELGLEKPSSNRPYLLTDSSNTLLFLGRLDEAGRRLAEVRSQVPDDHVLVPQVAAIELELAVHRGDLGAALEVEPGPGDLRAKAKATALLVIGRYEEALGLLERHRSAGARSPWREALAVRAEILLGRVEPARRRFDRLRTWGKTWRHGSLELRLVEAQLHGAEGRYDRCAQLAGEVRSGWLQLTDRLSPLVAAEIDRVEGECALRAGRPQEAVPLLESAAAGFTGLFGGRTVYRGRVEAALAGARRAAAQ